MTRNKMDRRGSGPLWFVILVLVVFGLYSATIALSTADDCGSWGRDWQIFPPEWECVPPSGFG
jgi:hypothetical protein